MSSIAEPGSMAHPTRVSGADSIHALQPRHDIGGTGRKAQAREERADRAGRSLFHGPLSPHRLRVECELSPRRTRHDLGWDLQLEIGSGSRLIWSCDSALSDSE